MWCSISAYGQTGPRSRDPGHDLNAQALSGLAWLERDANGKPGENVLPVADFSSGLAAVSGILAALLQRERTGVGVILDVAMTDAALGWAQLWGEGVDLAASANAWIGRSPIAAALSGSLLERLQRDKLYNLPSYGLFACRDKQWIALGVVDEDPFWRALCGELRLPFGRLRMSGRVLWGPAIRRIVALRLRTHDRAHWLTRLGAAGVPVTPVLDPVQARQEPQFSTRFDAAGVAKGPVPGGQPVVGRSPGLGEHTAQVLAGKPWVNSAR